jgi:hypothetical protein
VFDTQVLVWSTAACLSFERLPLFRLSSSPTASSQKTIPCVKLKATQYREHVGCGQRVGPRSRLFS